MVNEMEVLKLTYLDDIYERGSKIHQISPVIKKHGP
jgi:hypothetical protein